MCSLNSPKVELLCSRTDLPGGTVPYFSSSFRKFCVFVMYLSKGRDKIPARDVVAVVMKELQWLAIFEVLSYIHLYIRDSLGVELHPVAS